VQVRSLVPVVSPPAAEVRRVATDQALASVSVKPVIVTT